MRAIQVLEPGGPEALQLVQKPLPSVTQETVLVRVEASGVNFADILCRESRHPGMTPPPLIPGCEAAGRVEEVGSRISRFQVGDRVAVYSPFGGSYAEFMTAPEDYCLPLPEEMSYRQAAAFCHVFLTAYHALVTAGHAIWSERILVTAAAGGVGTALLQVARCLELQILAAVGSREKLPLVKQLGVENVVCYGEDSSVLDPETLGKVDLVLESVGGPIFERCLPFLEPLGRIVVFGFASGQANPVSPFSLLPVCGTYATFNLSVIFAHHPEMVRTAWPRLIRWFQSGRIQPLIHHEFSLAEAARAHRLMESRQSTGKILLLPGER